MSLRGPYYPLSEIVQVDSNLLVGAWLDSHCEFSTGGTELNRGCPVPLPPETVLSEINSYPPTSSSAASWESDAKGSSTCASTNKSPRLLLNPASSLVPFQRMLANEGGEENGGICGGGRLRGGAGNDRSRGMPGRPQRYRTRSTPGTPLDTSEQALDTDIAEGDGDTDTRSSMLSMRDSSARSSYAASLTDIAMPPPKKRKSGSLSPSKASSTYSDTRRKRQALFLSQPAGSFGIPDLADHEPEDALLIPYDVIAVLNRFSTGNFEIACLPRTPEIDALLLRSFPHERIPEHARLQITDNEADASVHALELVNFAIETHRACLRNSRVGEDEAAWYPLVRSLLSIEPPAADSTFQFARPPRHAAPYRWTVNDLFITIDATTKSTAADLAPLHATVKVDALVAFNSEHRTCKATVRRALNAALKVNAFADTLLASTVVVLAVEVKSSGGAGGEMEAEYQLGVWGMKTLNLMKRLAPHGTPGHVVSVSVCGHVWSLHVTHWRDGEIVTHGPVSVGATDTLYGTMKVVAFVKVLKEWARDEVWARWEALVEAATANAEE